MLQISDYRVKDGKEFSLKSFSTNDTNGFSNKTEAKMRTEKNIEKMAVYQDKLYADGGQSILVIIQALDAAGKDGIIKHVMRGLNPQGTKVFSFKQPSKEELSHDYLWRSHKATPEKGCIGIFNRSYYEDVLVVRVHNILGNGFDKSRIEGDSIWEDRFKQIKCFEKNLVQNGTTVIKLFLNLSKGEQKKRFLARIDDEAKNWKFSEADLTERAYWNDYQSVYQDAIKNTCTPYAPWYIIPADRKWFARFLVSEIINSHMEEINPEYPVVSDEQKLRLQEAKKQLLAESD